jgi:hypothetical protein
MMGNSEEQIGYPFLRERPRFHPSTEASLSRLHDKMFAAAK